MFGELYHNRVLELAAHIPNLGALTDAEAHVRKVSRVCGSQVEVWLKLDKAGDRVVAIGVEVRACALGQAAASVLSSHAVGALFSEIEAARDTLKAMLKSNGPPPTGRFWELRHLEGVREYPARHASTLLAFEAAVEAAAMAHATRQAAPSE